MYIKHIWDILYLVIFQYMLYVSLFFGTNHPNPALKKNLRDDSP